MAKSYCGWRYGQVLFGDFCSCLRDSENISLAWVCARVGVVGKIVGFIIGTRARRGLKVKPRAISEGCPADDGFRLGDLAMVTHVLVNKLTIFPGRIDCTGVC